MRKAVWVLVVLVVLVVFVVLGNLFLTMRDRVIHEDADDPEGNVLERQRAYLTQAKEAATRMDMVTIRTQVASFYTSKGRLPESLQELLDEGYGDAAVLKDKFDRSYRSGIEEDKFRVHSRGQDGIWNTKDDISNTP